MVAKVLPGIGKGVDEEMKTKYHKKGNAENWALITALLSGKKEAPFQLSFDTFNATHRQGGPIRPP